MAKKSDKFLVILESPGKKKKIESFLGDKYIVRASFGHIRDLDSKKLSINIEDNFKPDYTILKDKRNVVSDLTEASKRCKYVYLASDLDREGESIAWHLKEALKLTPEKTRRITFSEITKKAITSAIEKPGDIDMNLNNAQQARRIIDRLLGYKISPILWKQIQSSYKKDQSLSAGRVQSVVAKIIIERENEIKKHSSSSSFKSNGIFRHNDSTFNCILNEELPNKNESQEFLKLNQSSEYTLTPSVLKESIRKPSAPFITSSLQQEASSKFRISPKATMAVAQKLYECGLITYMRTDSKILSQDCLTDIENFVVENYGSEYFQLTQYSNDSKNAQEAHEAIRPCNISIKDIDNEDCYEEIDKKLYKLIWKRTIASQMSPCKVIVSNNKIILSNSKLYYTFKCEKVLFAGFTRVYKEHNMDDESDSENESSSYIEVKKAIKVNRNEIVNTLKFTKPKQSRYTEASLVKQLEKLGIGRPSTYSNMVSVIQSRGYTEKKSIEGEKKEIEIMTLNSDNTIDLTSKQIKLGSEKNKLFPTTIGMIVNNYLEKEFPILLDYDFTNQLENSLDRISRGEVQWYKIVKRVYNIFREKIDILSETKHLAKSDYSRELGEDSIGKYSVYIAKYGPVVCIKFEDGNRKFAPVKECQLETITLEHAKELFKYPKKLGTFKKKNIELCSGKYGLYLKYNSNNFSISDNVEEEITLEKAIEIILNMERKREETSGVLRVVNDDIVVKNGKYGHYIQFKGKTNVALPKKVGIDDLTVELCNELIEKKKKYRK